MIREQRALAAIVAIVVASLVTATFYTSPGPAGSSTTSTTTTSITSTTTTSITSTTTSSFTTTTSVVSTTTASSFSFSPSGPLQVISVSAQTTKDATGKVYLTLWVAYKNIGSDAVYMTRGCGSSLTANISSSSVIAENQGVRCLCAEFIAALNPGDSGSALTPGCWSGVTYQVLHSGTISVEMKLAYWGGQNQQNPGKTTIQASFTLE